MHFQHIGKILLSIQVHRGTRHNKHINKQKKQAQKTQNENAKGKFLEFSLGLAFYNWVKVW